MLSPFAVVVTAALAHAAPSPSPSDNASLERAVLDELNRLRADPPAYARELEALRSSYHGDLYVHGFVVIKTVEGVAALDEAIAYLKAAKPARALVPSTGLALAASEQMVDEGPTGTVGHRGRDGSNSYDRISRHGRSHALSGEVIDYGWDDAKDIVVDLLIDDGIKNRGHRNNVVEPLYAQAGVSCGPHARFKVMCVVEMAERYTERAAQTASREVRQ